MTNAEARTQLEDVLGVVREQLDIVEAICNDQLSCPIEIRMTATPGRGLEVNGETWTAPVALSIHRKAEVEFCDGCSYLGKDDAQNVCCKHPDNWERILIPFEKLEEWTDWDSDKHLEIPDECPLQTENSCSGKAERTP